MFLVEVFIGRKSRYFGVLEDLFVFWSLKRKIISNFGLCGGRTRIVVLFAMFTLFLIRRLLCGFWSSRSPTISLLKKKYGAVATEIIEGGGYYLCSDTL